MSNPVNNALRWVAGKAGFRVFSAKNFYESFVPYSRYGIEPIHHLRHFVDTSALHVCFDVGANRGQTAQYFAKVFPTATIYSFEPISATYSHLVSNTRHLKQVQPYLLALGSSNGTAIVTLADNDQVNTLVGHEAANGGGARTESVSITTIDSFLEKYRIPQVHLLKADTEGFELEVFKGAAKAFAEGRIDLVYCEVCFDPTDKLHTYFDDALRFLLNNNFRFLGLFESMHCDAPSQVYHANALFGRRDSRLLKPWAE